MRPPPTADSYSIYIFLPPRFPRRLSSSIENLSLGLPPEYIRRACIVVSTYRRIVASPRLRLTRYYLQRTYILLEPLITVITAAYNATLSDRSTIYY